MYNINKIMESELLSYDYIYGEVDKILSNNENYYIMRINCYSHNIKDKGIGKISDETTTEAVVKVFGSFDLGDIIFCYGKWVHNKDYGYSLKGRMVLIDSDEENDSITEKDLYCVLQNFPYHLTKNEASILINIYREEVLNIVEQNLFSVLQDTELFSFDDVDKIYKRSKSRLIGRIYSLIVEYTESSGNLFISKKILIEKIKKVLSSKGEIISDDSTDKSSLSLIDIEIVFLYMMVRDIITIEGDSLSLNKILDAEMESAINSICLNRTSLLPDIDVDKDIEEIESINSRELNVDFHYAPKQKEAISLITKGSFVIITGGPGTGKSTIIKAIISVIERNSDFKILMAAPTGRAAKRMKEATGFDSSTIHRLLKYIPGKGYTHNKDNPLDCDVLIVDESSMIDMMLMFALLQAVSRKTMLILIGDVDQLPPVGAGYPFRDLINSGVINVARLNVTFRQGKDSPIKTTATNIRDGINELIEKEGELMFHDLTDIEKMQSLIVERYTKYYKLELEKDKSRAQFNVQILTPTRKGELGVARINTLIQEKVNPKTSNKNECKVIDFNTKEQYLFREGDKVMQVVNSYEKNAFNGDLGIITKINNERKIIKVTFEDDSEVEYKFIEAANNIMLAYAITIHKSQGSEYAYAIVINTIHHKHMLQRNLFYTGITRVKKILDIIGDRDAVSFAISNETVNDRKTRFTEILKDIKFSQMLVEEIS